MRRATRNGWLVIVLVICAAPAFSQVKWLADASSAEIPSGKASGSIDGSAFVANYGRLSKTGNISSGEIVFEHFTVELRDAEKFWLAKFSVDLNVTVKKGELPDGRTFRRLPKGTLDESQPSLGDKWFRVPEFPSLGMSGRAEFPAIGNRLSSSPEMLFSAVVTFGTRKDGSIPIDLYVCFHDQKKSCVAGRANLEIVDSKDQ